MRNKAKLLLKENRSFILFISLMLVFRSAVADWNDVPTGSMKPTIVEGDRIIVNKIAYDLKIPFSQYTLANFTEPQVNDIVVFESVAADERLVKRIIAIPGDVVAMRNNQLIINNQVANYNTINRDDHFIISEESINGHKRTIRTLAKPGHYNGNQSASFNPIKIPAGYFLMMGDNRDNSSDSRAIGLVPREEIIGRSKQIALSLNYDNYLLPRSDRFLKTL